MCSVIKLSVSCVTPIKCVHANSSISLNRFIESNTFSLIGRIPDRKILLFTTMCITQFNTRFIFGSNQFYFYPVIRHPCPDIAFPIEPTISFTPIQQPSSSFCYLFRLHPKWMFGQETLCALLKVLLRTPSPESVSNLLPEVNA